MWNTRQLRAGTFECSKRVGIITLFVDDSTGMEESARFEFMQEPEDAEIQTESDSRIAVLNARDYPEARARWTGVLPPELSGPVVTALLKSVGVDKVTFNDDPAQSILLNV